MFQLIFCQTAGDIGYFLSHLIWWFRKLYSINSSANIEINRGFWDFGTKKTSFIIFGHYVYACAESLFCIQKMKFNRSIPTLPRMAVLGWIILYDLQYDWIF